MALKKTPSLTDRPPEYEELYKEIVERTAPARNQPDTRIKLVVSLLKRYLKS